MILLLYYVSISKIEAYILHFMQLLFGRRIHRYDIISSTTCGWQESLIKHTIQSINQLSNDKNEHTPFGLLTWWNQSLKNWHVAL